MSTRQFCAALMLLVSSWSAHAALLKVTLDGAAFQGSSVRVDYNFKGLPGDTIEISDGKHELLFLTTNDYTFSVRIAVTGDNLAIESTSHRSPNCKQPQKVTWAQPQTSTSGRKYVVTQLLVPEPVFGERLGATACAQPSMASCDSRKIILKATSNPKAAEIWIDGSKLEQKTDVTLSVPYCQYDKTKRVVYRLAGRVNCEQELVMAPDATVDSSCELKAIELDRKK